MTLFEIEDSIRTVLDTLESLIGEDGVLTEEAEQALAELDSLNLAKETKLENTALYIKQLTYEVKALQEEKKNIDSRIRQKRNTTEYLKGLLDKTLDGHKFETARARVSFRKSTRVEVGPEFANYAQAEGLVDLVKVDINIKPKKDMIKKALQNGEQIEHCHLVTGRNVIIK